MTSTSSPLDMSGFTNDHVICVAVTYLWQMFLFLLFRCSQLQLFFSLVVDLVAAKFSVYAAFGSHLMWMLACHPHYDGICFCSQPPKPLNATAHENIPSMLRHMTSTLLPSHVLWPWWWLLVAVTLCGLVPEIKEGEGTNSSGTLPPYSAQHHTHPVFLALSVMKQTESLLHQSDLTKWVYLAISKAILSAVNSV